MAKTAVVVGGTGGIGRNIVGALEGIGCRVAVISRGQQAFVFQPHDHPLVSTYVGDTTNEEDLKPLVTTIFKEHGSVDYAVYSVGLPPDIDKPMLEYPPDEWDRTFETYVKGFLLFFQATLPHMSQGGHFVVIGSAVTRFPADALPPIFAGHYAAAKAALAESVKWARREAHGKGAFLSLIVPGAVDTANHQTGTLARIPKRLLPVTTVTNAVVAFLLQGVEGDLQLIA